MRHKRRFSIVYKNVTFMKKIGIFYGSTTGYTADVASRIAKALGVEMKDVYDVANTAPSTLGDYDIIILGSSTWGDGELQENWEDFIQGAQEMYLKGKEIALFGLGDENFGGTFCNAVGEIYRRMQGTEATFIAPFNADGYDFIASGAIVDGKCVGLVLDEVNHSDLTDARIAEWVKEIKA